MSKFQTNISRVKGIGIHKGGTHHWWMMRLTSIALVPLGLWFIFHLIQFSHNDIFHFYLWLKDPLNVGLLSLFLIITFHHGSQGMQVIYEDYIHHEGSKLFAIYATHFLSILLCIVSLICVFKISFGSL